MRPIILFLAIMTFFSCGQTYTKQKELELKERELALREKELALKTNESVKSKINLVDTSNRIVNITTEQKIYLPFIGKKGFETQPGMSGSGTPSRYIEILENGDVYFGFIQENQADGSITKEKYYAGKYKLQMKCFFKKWNNEVTYYRVTKEKIYEVDKNNKQLKGTECCSLSNSDSNDNCPCQSAYY